MSCLNTGRVDELFGIQGYKIGKPYYNDAKILVFNWKNQHTNPKGKYTFLDDVMRFSKKHGAQ